MYRNERYVCQSIRSVYYEHKITVHPNIETKGIALDALLQLRK